MSRSRLFSPTHPTRARATQEPDLADRVLEEERARLLSLKRSLEAQLRRVQQQLQTLGAARARLAAVIQERSRVTDLLCHSMSSTVHTASPVGAAAPLVRPQQQRRLHSKSYSAPVPIEGLAKSTEERLQGGK